MAGRYPIDPSGEVRHRVVYMLTNIEEKSMGEHLKEFRRKWAIYCAQKKEATAVQEAENGA